MHRITLVLLAALACAAVPITISRDVPEQFVQGNPLAPVLPSGVEVPIPLNVDLEAESEARNTGPARRVSLEDVRLDITDTEEPAGDQDDWDFISSIVVDIESTSGDLPRIEVARLDEVPTGRRTIHLETDSSTNLREYVEQGARLVATVRGMAPPDDVSYAGEVTLGLAFR